MVDWLLGSSAGQVLDLGAGTGKLTRSVVAGGRETFAVDPSREMLARLQQALPQVEARIGTAESIPMPDESVDAVVVGQAWHWVDPSKAVPEIARVLRPGGTLGLVWNVRDDSVTWVAQLNRLVDGDVPDPTYKGPPVVGPPFGAMRRHEMRWDYPLSETALIDLAASRSKTILLPPVARAALEAGLRRLFAEVAHEGIMTIPYITYGFRTALTR